MQFEINDAQARSLIGVLVDHCDGEPVLLTHQEDNTLVVAFNMATVEIDQSGHVEEN